MILLFMSTEHIIANWFPAAEQIIKKEDHWKHNRAWGCMFVDATDLICQAIKYCSADSKCRCSHKVLRIDINCK